MESEFQSSVEIVDKLIRTVSAGHVDEAARVYSRCQEDIGFLMINRMPENKRVQTQLAKMFFVAKDFQKAALVFENTGEKEKAAILYEKADDYGMAAEMFCQAGRFAKGAAMFEKAGNFEQAATFFQQEGMLERAAANFERAINNYLAGKTYFQLGKYDKAMELLQKIGEADHTYLEATLMIGGILSNQGFHDLAIRKYQAIIQSQGVNEETMGLYYELGILHEKAGHPEAAKEVYERILTTNFGFKDVAQRLKGLSGNKIEVVEVVEEAVIEDAALLVEEVPEAPEVAPEIAAADEKVVSMNDGIEFLKDTPLFEELSLQEMKLFWARLAPVTVEPGSVIIEQDVVGEAFFLLTAGTVVVERDQEGRTDKLAELGAGKFFGEMSLMDSSAVTSARVKALSECELLRMERAVFVDLLESYDRLALKVYRAFARTLMDRLRSTNQALTAYKVEKEKELAKLFGG